MGADDPFFVVGCPRSGTTLLSVMLDRHSRVCVPPETGYFLEIAPRLWYRTRSAGLLPLLRGWPRLGELGLDPDAVMRRLPRDGPLARALLTTILGLCAEREGKVRAGEKTPLHLMRVRTIVKRFPGARVICMLRDGRETSLSLAAMPWHTGTLLDAANLWRRSVRTMEACERRHPDRVLVVRYEDLVRAPRRTLQQVMGFLGERFEDAQLSTAVASRSVLQRSMAWKGEALRGVDLEAVGRRSRCSPPEHVALLDRVLSRELIRYGYARA